jgi:Zn-dependent protease with chaperone function
MSRLSRLVERLHGAVTIAWIVSGILGVVALLTWQLVDFGDWPLVLIAVPAVLIALAAALDSANTRLTRRSETRADEDARKL